MNDMELTRSIIALSQIRGLGRKKINKILCNVHDLNQSNFWELIEVGIHLHLIPKNKTIGDFLDARGTADHIMEISDHNGIKIINQFSTNFPSTLNYDDGPILLYFCGSLELLNYEKRGAVIGTRVPSQIGYEFAQWAGESMAKKDIVVVSGLAKGCDRAAHEACLNAGGKTIGFLPSNLINIMPKENKNIAKRICEEGGCLISEYSTYDIANAGMFIERDRLQAASAQYIITSEFAPNSGTLHTLQFAHQYNRPICSSLEIHKSSQSGFEELEIQKIPYQIFSRDDLLAFIDKF